MFHCKLGSFNRYNIFISRTQLHGSVLRLLLFDDQRFEEASRSFGSFIGLHYVLAVKIGFWKSVGWELSNDLEPLAVHLLDLVYLNSQFCFVGTRSLNFGLSLFLLLCE